MLFESMDRIVFAGDSVTDMQRARPIGEGLFDNLGFGYVRMIDNLLAAWYPERHIRVTNVGTGGNTSRDLLNRFTSDVVNLNPDWVSICIGVNDVWRQFDSTALRDQQVSPEEYENNLEQMIAALPDSLKGLFLLSPFYIEPNRSDPMRARMDEYTAICRQTAEKHHAVFVDFQALFDRYCLTRHSSAIAWDRVHPNQKGATLMAGQFLTQCGFDFAKPL